MTQTEIIANTIKHNSQKEDKAFFEREIAQFKASAQRKSMIDGVSYFKGKHDILKRKRMVIGANGELQEVKNLPNNHLINNQYRKHVNQKNNYLLGQPIVIKSENSEYEIALKKILNKRFLKLLKNIGKDALNCGIGWLYPYYNERGEFSFKRFAPFEIIPEWKDDEHEELDCAIRIYEVSDFDGIMENIVEKVEVYKKDGIYKYALTNNNLVFDGFFPYFFVENGEEETGYNWERVPLIPFKCNSEEIPLISNVKSLQDALNSVLSNFENEMDEDSHNTILVLINYTGQNLAEFRQNLNTYGAVNIQGDGDVKTLQVEINAENYKAISELLKNAIVENAMSYDAKDDRLSGNPNQMNIQSMYSDIDLDANETETEFQASFEQLLWFLNCYFEHENIGSFDGEQVEIIFNRDILINESEAIENCNKSVGILSDETIVSQHPWVDDINAELVKIKKQSDEENKENTENQMFTQAKTVNVDEK